MNCCDTKHTARLQRHTLHNTWFTTSDYTYYLYSRRVRREIRAKLLLVENHPQRGTFGAVIRASDEIPVEQNPERVGLTEGDIVDFNGHRLVLVDDDPDLFPHFYPAPDCPNSDSHH